MVAMKGFALALEPHFIEEIDEAMKHLDFARSERYRNLIILGLDEYAISDSNLRKKRFPIKGEIGESFSVMISDAINKEIMSVKEKRKQTKKLAMRYIVLLGFEKWKRDQDNLKCQKVEPFQEINVDEKVEPGVKAVKETYKPWQKNIDYSERLTTTGPGIITSGDGENFKMPSGSNDMNIGEKFQAVIDLIRELDLKITIEKK